MTNQEAKNRPVFKGKVERVQLAVWENKSKEGQTFHSFSLSRSYATPGKDGERIWQQSNVFSEKDLPDLLRAIEMANQWLTQTQQSQDQAS